MSFISSNAAGRPLASLADAKYLDAGSHRIVPRDTSRELRSEGGRTLTFATPPSWTEKAKCVQTAHFGKTKDQMYDRDQMTDEWAERLCAGCPVIEACLAAAMEAEGDVVARNRYGVWGGTTPKMREALNAAEKECKAGHKGEQSTYVDARGRTYWYCKACNRETARESRERRKSA